MNIVKLTTTALLVAGFASTAHAQDSDVYAAIGVNTYEFDIYGVEGKLGYNINDYFGIEGQAGFGIIDESQDFNENGVTGEVSLNVDYQFAGFGVVRYPVSDNFDVFGRAGYHTVEFGIDAEATDGTTVESLSDSFSDDGFALGAGGTYMWNDSNGIRAEYTYSDVSGGGLDSFTLSYVRNF